MRKSTILFRAQGALVGQLVGDALGTAVEGWTPDRIRATYPDGVREMMANDELQTIPGQLTDDSEMALVLARSLVDRGEYDAAFVRGAYLQWLQSGAFGYNPELGAALEGNPDVESVTNGALMRVSPIGIFGAGVWSGVVELWANEDCLLTHPNPVCLAANELFAAAIATAIAVESPPEALFEHLRARAETDGLLADIVKRARNARPHYLERPDLVIICLQNALYQLVHAESFEEALVDTINQGGDTDTNAAVCGALLGAVHGIDAIPKRWVKKVLSCTPKAGNRGVARPRPEEYWPIDALDLAGRLVSEHSLGVTAEGLSR